MLTMHAAATCTEFVTNTLYHAVVSVLAADAAAVCDFDNSLSCCCMLR
jgi:hypothetical protein